VVKKFQIIFFGNFCDLMQKRNIETEYSLEFFFFFWRNFAPIKTLVLLLRYCQKCEICFKKFTFILFYSQNWINVPMDDCHFGSITKMRNKKPLQLGERGARGVGVGSLPLPLHTREGHDSPICDPTPRPSVATPS